MNVTLAMPADLVADSRRYAAEHGTTLNALIRSLLDGLRTKRDARKELAERKKAADDLIKMLNSMQGRSPKGWKFDREECHIRNPERGW